MDRNAENYRRFLDGDDSAFDEIMQELFYNLMFFVNRYVHDIHTAEDISVDVFSQLVAYKHKYNFKVSLKTYLFMLGKSRALDYLRHKKSVTFVEFSVAEDVSSDEKQLEDIVIESERKRIVNDAINKLPADMREAVHLIYFEDLSYEDAARVMNKRFKQIDNLLYRAKKELYTIIGEDGRALL